MLPTSSPPSTERFSPEVELLLCCTRTCLEAPTHDRLHQLVQGPIDWPALIEMAVDHGVMPLLYWNLKQAASAQVPNAVLAHLQTAFQTNAQRNLLLMQELLRVLQCFEAHAIRAVPFKGPLLAAMVYRNLAFRQISDLDILVRKQDLTQGIDLLSAEGYRVREQVPWATHLIREAGFYNIDLHSTIAPQHLSHPIPSETVWQLLEPTPFAGATIPTFSPEMQLLLLCLHGTKDSWANLDRMCDIAELIRCRTIHWPQAIDLAKTWGMQRLTGLGLKLAHQLLQAELPIEVQQWIQFDPAIQTLADQITQRLFVQTKPKIEEVERTLFHVRTRERWQDQFGSLWGLMHHSGWFTPTHHDEAFLSLPANLAFLHYISRPIRLLGKYGPMLLQSLR